MTVIHNTLLSKISNDRFGIKSNIETKTSPFPINLPYDTVTVYGHITPFPFREGPGVRLFSTFSPS